MKEHRPGCCLPQLISYSFFSALSFASLSTMNSSYCDVSKNAALIHGLCLGAMLPFAGKLFDNCLYPKENRRIEKSLGVSTVVLTGATASSALFALIMAQSFDEKASLRSLAKLTFLDLGISVTVIGVMTLGGICIMTQWLHVHTKHMPKSKITVI